MNDIRIEGDTVYGLINAIELTATPTPAQQLYIELSGMGGSVGVYLSVDKLRFLRDYLTKYIEQEQQ